MTVSLIWCRCSDSSGPNLIANDSARSAWKISRASCTSGSVSSITQPSVSKILRRGSSAAVTRRSIGRPPRSRLQAIRTPRKSRSSGRRNVSPASVIAIGAGRAQTPDDEAVDGGNVVAIDRRAERRANALGRHQVLVGDRQAEERPRRFAARKGGVLRARIVERALGGEGDDGVDLRVHAL